MTRWNTIFIRSGITALVVAALTTSAYGFVSAGGGGPTGGIPVGIGTGAGVHDAQTFALQVVCTNCTLEEAKRAYPDQLHLYTFRHRLGEAVVKVAWGDNGADASENRHLWQTRAALSDSLWVRANDEVLSALMARENRFKPFAVNAVLRKNRTLDIGTIRFLG